MKSLTEEETIEWTKVLVDEGYYPPLTSGPDDLTHLSILAELRLKGQSSEQLRLLRLKLMRDPGTTLFDQYRKIVDVVWFINSLQEAYFVKGIGMGAFLSIVADMPSYIRNGFLPLRMKYVCELTQECDCQAA